MITTRDVGDMMVVFATCLKYHRCRLPCLPFVWHFFHCDTRARARKNTRPVLVATRGGSQELGTRAYILVWQNLTGHGDDVGLACVDCCACCWFGTVASL